MGNIHSFFNNKDSHPWTKHILLFVHQALGSSMTLGRFYHYIELCSPPFGYSSKHGEIFMPPASQNYVNVTLPESNHILCFCPKFYPTQFNLSANCLLTFMIRPS
jgi:hypothetical protein